MNEEKYSVLVEILVTTKNKTEARIKVKNILNKAERSKFGFIIHRAELL